MAMKYKPIYEFLVWDNCNNNCKFCFQRENPRLFNFNTRKLILDETLRFIESANFLKGSHVLICGGELFDKESDFEILLNFFNTICEKMLNNEIDLLYINTNLIYKNLNGLLNVLDLIQKYNLFSRLKFTTSFDLKGRFKSEEIKQLMLNNLLFIKNKYSDCNIVTNIILTKDVCEGILENTFDLTAFMLKYKCWVNLIPYIIYDKSLAASRSDIFKALITINNKNPNYLKEYIPNICIKQDKLLYLYENGQFNFCSCKLNDCGHSINFKRYSEKNTCFCCDLKYLFG